MYLVKNLSLLTHRFPLFGFCWLILLVQFKTFLWISCKLTIGSRGWIRLSFCPLGKTVGGVVVFHQEAHAVCLPLFCEVNSCCWARPSSVHSQGVSKGQHSNPIISFSYISYIEDFCKERLPLTYHLATQWCSSHTKGRIDIWFFSFSYQFLREWILSLSSEGDDVFKQLYELQF